MQTRAVGFSSVRPLPPLDLSHINALHVGDAVDVFTLGKWKPVLVAGGGAEGLCFDSDTQVLGSKGNEAWLLNPSMPIGYCWYIWQTSL